MKVKVEGRFSEIRILSNHNDGGIRCDSLGEGVGFAAQLRATAGEEVEKFIKNRFCGNQGAIGKVLVKAVWWKVSLGFRRAIQ